MLDGASEHVVVLFTLLFFVAFVPLHEALLRLDVVADLIYAPKSPPPAVSHAYENLTDTR